MQTILQAESFELSDLAEEAENLRFEDFLNFKSQWLKTGRLIWFVYGNISAQTTLQMACSCNNQISLTPESRKNLQEYRILSIPEQKEGN